MSIRETTLEALTQEVRAELTRAHGAEFCAIHRDQQAVAHNYYGAMDFWSWVLVVGYMNGVTVEVIEKDGGRRNIQIGSFEPASELVKKKFWSIERDVQTGNCEVLGANKE